MGDLAASFCALAELVSRVTARIVKSEDWVRRASITAPPCLPVAPVMGRTLSLCGRREGYVGY